MRKVMCVAVAVLSLMGLSAVAQEQSRQALAEQLLNLMNARQNIEQSFAMVKQMIPKQMERVAQATGQTNAAPVTAAQTDKMMDMISKELSWDNLKQDYINLYAETFSAEELKGIVAFYQSAAGQAFTKKQPELMKKSMALSQKMMMQIIPKMTAMSKETSTNEPPRAPAVDVQPENK